MIDMQAPQEAKIPEVPDLVPRYKNATNSTAPEPQNLDRGNLNQTIADADTKDAKPVDTDTEPKLDKPDESGRNLQ